MLKASNVYKGAYINNKYNYWCATFEYSAGNFVTHGKYHKNTMLKYYLFWRIFNLGGICFSENHPNVMININFRLKQKLNVISKNSEELAARLIYLK